jgi:purine-binding chemotaxis protein CheW
MSEEVSKSSAASSASQKNPAAGPRSARPGGKFLTYFLASEEYGLEILKVHEIIGMMPITRVPRTPHFIRGVINLRGKVIPVVDLRLKFAMEAHEQTEETCTIVVQAQGVDMGIIVDKVSEVLDINPSDIQDPPYFGPEVRTDYLLGIAKTGERVKLLLDIDKVLSSQEVIDVRSASVVTGAGAADSAEAK